MSRYGPFLRRFPSFRALAAASVQEVIGEWKGLGYNRRALALRESARIVATQMHGRLPRTVDELRELPGVGHATACAVLVYSFGIPLAFIETNIRRVFLHFFFSGEEQVTDARILPFVEQAMDRSNPREWYYALMDLGTALATAGDNPNRKSARYRKQAPFEGSLRQLRGRILSVLLEKGSATAAQIEAVLGWRDARFPNALQQLVSEGFLFRARGRYSFR